MVEPWPGISQHLLSFAGFENFSATAQFCSGLQNGSKMSFLACLSQVMPLHCANASGSLLRSEAQPLWDARTAALTALNRFVLA